MSKLALSIIAKDEVENVKKIIEKYGKYFDEIAIAVDDKLEEFNALADEKVKIHPYVWCNDFSHKRNFLALKTESPYYLRMDTDDDLGNPEIIPKLFQQILKNDIDVLYVMYDYAKNEKGEVVAQHWREAIIKKRNDVYWKKEIHENIYFENQENCRLSRDHVLKIIHNITNEHAATSAKRNIEYLLTEFKRDGERTDPRTLAYIGRMFYSIGLAEQAIFFLEKLISKSAWNDDKYFAFIQLSQCYQSLKKYDLAISCCNEALGINTKFPDAFIQLGYIYMDKGDYDKAVDWILPATVRPMPDTCMVIDPTFYGARAKMAAAMALLGKGDIQLAVQYYQDAKKASNNDPEITKFEETFLQAHEGLNFTKNLAWMCLYLQNNDRTKIQKLLESIPRNAFKDERVWQIRNAFALPRKHGDKEISIFCGPAWEDWSPVSTMKGIGGSEEAVIYLSNELTNLGYKVTVFNSCGDMEGTYEGVEYKPYHAFNVNDEYNILIGWRRNSLSKLKAKKKFIWLHDVPQDNMFSTETVKDIDKIIVLSEFHKSLLPSFIPKEKIFVSSNGINLKDFNTNGVLRNPKRMIYTSSYDRGIEHLLNMWADVRKEVPEAELNLFYGWDTFDAMVKSGARDNRFKEYMVELMKQPGVIEHGRIGHKRLIKEFQKSGIWVYPSKFEEISCISAMKAQAAGCVPVCTDYAALSETIKAGVKVKGNADEKEVRKEFKEKVIEILKDENRQEVIRDEVLKHKESFGWDRVACAWHEQLFSNSEVTV